MTIINLNRRSSAIPRMVTTAPNGSPRVLEHTPFDKLQYGTRNFVVATTAR